MSNNHSVDPYFQRLSREMATGATFDAVTVAAIIQHGNVEVWAQRLATFRSNGLLVLRRAGLAPDDRHAVYGFASKMYGRVEGSRTMLFMDSDTEPIEGHLATDLDRPPKELGGRNERSLMDGPPDLTRVGAFTRAQVVEAFVDLVEAFYGTSSFTLGRVKRLPWFSKHTGINTGHDAFQVVEALVGLDWLVDLTGNTLHQKHDNRSFRLAANNRIADRTAMRSGMIWGEDRCVRLVEEVINDSDLLEACSAVLRSIAGNDEGWFVVNREVTDILRATFDWPRHTHHQQFVERFLVLLAATPIALSLQIRTELSSDDGGVDVLYCRCVSTRSSEEDDNMAHSQGVKGSQTSKAENLDETQVAACVGVLPDVLREFWDTGLVKVGDLESKNWFRNGPIKAGVQAPAFASLLIKLGYADVASDSYAEGSRNRRIKLKKRDRRIIFLAMEHNATSGVEAVRALIDRLRTDSDTLDKIEKVLVEATEAAAPAECFTITAAIARQIRSIVEPSDEVYTNEFAEYFLRRLANAQMMLDLDEYFGEGEDESFTTPVMSRFRCTKRTQATLDEQPEVSVEPPSPAEVEGGYTDAGQLETLTSEPQMGNKESPEEELARLRAEYGMEEVELQRRAEAQRKRLAHIEALELQVRRSRQIESIVQATLDRISQEVIGETERVILQRTIGRRLLECADTPAE